MSRWHSPPAALYALVEQTPATMLLESAKPSAGFNPGDASDSQSEWFSRLFTAPLRVCVADDHAELPTLLAEIESAVAVGHFAAGFFTYECGGCFEPTAGMAASRPGQPLAWFGIYDRCHLFDHRTGAFAGSEPPGLARLHASAPNQPPAAAPAVDAVFTLTEERYAERIAAIREWIRSGDVYQLNFTAPLEIQAHGSPAALYQRLRSRQPAPYCAFLHCLPNRHILSFSPELFFRVEGHGPARRIATRPMKGTAPRGRTNREDHDQAEWLRNDPKNRAENVMIVDLLRNDLGRLCSYGTVRAERLFAVERYPTLWQMTSTVTGELRPEVGFRQIFRALFPCGSVTGAPKVRAMQLLAEIEQRPRGVYTGAIGFFSREQTVFNVAIRTLELDGGCGVMGVGSGIVIDSDPAGEFRECLLKAEFLTAADNRLPEQFELLESLLWRQGYPLLERHLDRLIDSADFYGFACDRHEARSALLDCARSFDGTEPRKVRLLLHRDGSLKLESEIIPLETIAPNARPLRAHIARERTDPTDTMLFHKTTHRPLYATALEAAIEAGFDDVLFLNQRGEVTESARANVFVEKDGRWLTPPIECGLLAGIQRSQILRTQPGVDERVLFVEDLRQADAVYLSNAVRGLRRATIDWQDT